MHLLLQQQKVTEISFSRLLSVFFTRSNDVEKSGTSEVGWSSRKN